MGRADGVLNPSGVRFGSSEIYAVIDAHFSDRITDSLCVGQRRRTDVDESVMLFVLMRNGQTLRKNLVKDIKAAIAKELSKRHVPKYIFEMPELPVSTVMEPASPKLFSFPYPWSRKFYMRIRIRLHQIQITVNHKKVELPVKQIVSGQPVQLSGTLLNPRSLEYFRQFVQVEKLGSSSSKL